MESILLASPLRDRFWRNQTLFEPYIMFRQRGDYVKQIVCVSRNCRAVLEEGQHSFMSLRASSGRKRVYCVNALPSGMARRALPTSFELIG